MDGIHDLGGMHGFGPVDTTQQDDEPWGVRVNALMLVLAVGGNLPGAFRSAIEQMEPGHYLTSSYFERWLAAIERLRRAADEQGTPPNPPAAPEVMRTLFGPRPTNDPSTPAPRFSTDDAVLVTHRGSPGHTRCPRYVRGRVGTVVRVHGAQPIPDEYAAVPPTLRPEPSYSVRFACRDLFPDGDADATVTVDLWESYLDVG